MGKSVRNTLKDRYELISQTVKNIENDLARLPEGRIIARKINGKTYYYIDDEETKDRYLDQNSTSLIKDLIQKSYLKTVLKSAKRELAALEKMMKLYPAELCEDIFAKLPEDRKAFATPMIPGNEKDARKWMDAPYTRKPFKKGAPVYKTLRGERVRSKSEVIIADRLYAYGIPYRYECPLMVGNQVIHPDFSMLRMSDGKVIYHEHCGKMDSPEYAEDMVKRVNSYNQAGIIQGDRLTFTFETTSTPLDIRVIDRLINEYFK